MPPSALTRYTCKQPLRVGVLTSLVSWNLPEDSRKRYHHPALCRILPLREPSCLSGSHTERAEDSEHQYKHARPGQTPLEPELGQAPTRALERDPDSL